MNFLRNEPLIPFLLIAGLLLWFRTPEPNTERVIQLSQSIRDGLKKDFERQRRRAPSEAELAGLETAWIEMEMLSREARRLGLDRNDPVVRRRLAQAMRFFLENGLPPEPPSDAEVQAYIEQHQEELALPRRRRFVHLFFSRQRRQDQAQSDAAKALEGLMDEGAKDTPPRLGDPFIHGRVLGPIDQTGLAKRLGAPFAEALFKLPMGPRWQGPIESSFGFHLIRLLEDKAPGLPKADILQADVRRRLEKTARGAEGEARLEDLKQSYRIER
ncbi:MAG: hypothetical protein CMH55_09710 [Myxococcales bacterium]|nr:hypothetical protein [Myxococcales bacterium]